MRIVTETELRDRIRPPQLGLVMTFPPGTRFTPSARDFIKQWQIEIRIADASQCSTEAAK